MVTKTIEVPVDQIEVHADIGPGRVVRAVLFIEEPPTAGNQAPSYDDDPFGKELDDLLASMPPVPHFVDDSRESIYSPDDHLPSKATP